MAANCLPVVMCALLGGGPAVVSPAAPSTSMVVAGAGSQMPASSVPGGCTDVRYPFDAQDAWTHGYIQEVPAYGGFAAFRPYNYKHILTQSAIAAGWGLSPAMPYSQQLWRREGSRAGMVDENSSDGTAASEFSSRR